MAYCSGTKMFLAVTPALSPFGDKRRNAKLQLAGSIGRFDAFLGHPRPLMALYPPERLSYRVELMAPGVG